MLAAAANSEMAEKVYVVYYSARSVLCKYALVFTRVCVSFQDIY